MSLHYNVSIDTGGTFTDCIATDSEGKIYRKKILSNGTLRGQAIASVSEKCLKIKESWYLSKDILAGYIDVDLHVLCRQLYRPSKAN